MNLTNLPKSLQSLPMPFARAMLRSDYDKNGSLFSVTQLLGCPRRTHLAIDNEPIRSTYSMFSAFIGTSMHHTFERNTVEAEGEICERRVHANILGADVSGQIDLYCEQTIYDYKTVRAPKSKIEEKHYDQVQMNGYLAELNSFEVKRVAVIYIDITWQHSRSLLDPNYPQSPWNIFVHDYDREHAIQLFNKTIPDHLAALDGKPRDCTGEEQWQRPTVYAITKPGAGRASKLCDSYAEAQELLKPGQIIEKRPGMRVFCGSKNNSMCGYAFCCPQFAREQMESTSEP